MLAIESIPDQDRVHRLIDYPVMFAPFLLVPDSNQLFEFQSEKDGGFRCESVVWNRYASTESAVHQIGELLESKRRQKRSDMRYAGFMSARVLVIRRFKTRNGHGYDVCHEPSQGIFHAHICLLPDPTSRFTRNERNELRVKLGELFTDFVKNPGWVLGRTQSD